MLLFLLFLLLPSQLALHFWPSWSFVLGRPIDYLSPTVYVTDLLVLLIIATSFKDTYLKPFYSKKTLLIFLFIFLNIFFSTSPQVSLFSWLRYSEYFLFALVLFHHKNISWQLPLSLAAVWTSFIAILQFILQKNIGGILYWLGERPLMLTNQNVAKIIIDGELILRPYATLSHPNALAGFLLVCYWLIKNKIVRLIIIPTLFLTFSRTAIAVFLFMLIIQLKNRLIKIFGIVLLFIGITLTLNTTSFSERLILFNHSLHINSSLISGVGLGSYISSIAEKLPYLLQPVHSIYILLLSELGLPVFIFLIIHFIKSYKISLPLIAILLTGLADHYWLTLHQNQLLLVLVLVLCLNPKKLSNT